MLQHSATMLRSLARLAVARQNKAIAAWVNSINELHRSKPPTQVNYGKLMPDIEQLMQVGRSACPVSMGGHWSTYPGVPPTDYGLSPRRTRHG